MAVLASAAAVAAIAAGLTWQGIGGAGDDSRTPVASEGPSDPDLPPEGDDGRPAAEDGQARTLPGGGAAVDVEDGGDAGVGELLAGLGGAAAGLTDHADGGRRGGAEGGDGGGGEGVEREGVSAGGVEAGESDREAYLSAISGLTFRDSPAQGSIVGQRFIHPANKFTFTVPQGYALQTSQSAVVGVAGDGEAVRFDSAQVQDSMSLTDYLKSGWIAGLKAETVTASEHNGLEMASGLAQTDQWFFRVAVVRLDGDVYRFIFAAKSDSPRFEQGAQATIESFRRTTVADLSQIRQLSIRLVTARAGDTADRLATQMANIPGARDLFYILNNLYPGDPVTPGQRYKVVAGP